MKINKTKAAVVFSAALLLLASLPVGVAGAATITVVNFDGPGEGFNDMAPVIPVTGNPGTTLGQQRLIAFQGAAEAWGAIVDSGVEILVAAEINSLFCDSVSAVLGSAGPVSSVRCATQFDGQCVNPDFPRPGTWYAIALANSLVGFDLVPPGGLGADEDIGALFNGNLDYGDPNCLGGMTWWYGLGAPAPAGTVDFFSTVFHEIAHGLGFTTFVNKLTGVRPFGFDDAFMLNLEDHSSGELWPDMTDDERAASAIDTGDLHWVGANAVSRSGMLAAGTHPSGHVRMYAPDPLQGGSSVSHWDTALFPDEIMEPVRVSGAQDIVTTALMEDISWPLLAAPGDSPPYDPADPTQLGLLDGRYVVTARYIGAGPDWLQARRMTVLDNQGLPSQTTGGMAFGNPKTMSIAVSVRDACGVGFTADWAAVGSMDLALWELEIRRVADGAVWTRVQPYLGNTSGIDQQAFPCM